MEAVDEALTEQNYPFTAEEAVAVEAWADERSFPTLERRESLDVSTAELVEQVVEAYEEDEVGLVHVAPCMEAMTALVEAAVEGITSAHVEEAVEAYAEETTRVEQARGPTPIPTPPNRSSIKLFVTRACGARPSL